MSTQTPPGPYDPAGAVRRPGQRPRFLSRRSTGFVIVLVVIVVAVVIAASLALTGDEGTTPEFSSEDYRAGQEQFIALIGEQAFARFEHGHPPLDCSSAEWRSDPLACSETWLHRFEVAELTGEAVVQPGDVVSAE